MHLDFDDAVALAGLAAPPLDVEREAPRLIAARLGFRQLGEPVADRREGAGIGGRVRARRAPDGRLVDVDHLVEEFHALDLVVGRGMLAALVQLARGGLVQRLDHQRGFAAARNAGDAGQRAQRNGRRDVLQIVALGAEHLEPAIVRRLAPLGGNRNLLQSDEIFSRQAVGVGHDLVRRAFGDDVPAVNAGARPHVDHVIGGADGFLIMLHHDHGVAEIAQALQRFQQLDVVALVQADGRLIEHIEHAGEPGTDLRGEADALTFAARQRAGIAAQREIFQPYIVEEFQPGADFLEDARGDFLLLLGQILVEIAEPGVGQADRFFADLTDMQPADLHRQRFGLEAIAIADVAR